MEPPLGQTLCLKVTRVHEISGSAIASDGFANWTATRALPDCPLPALSPNNCVPPTMSSVVKSPPHFFCYELCFAIFLGVKEKAMALSSSCFKFSTHTEGSNQGKNLFYSGLLKFQRHLQRPGVRT